jgi:DNA-binding PadR family transcriptional regulator
MYYELLILGRLMFGPYHGYMIISVLGEMVGPWQKVSSGTLYPLLARLERDGQIETADPAATEPAGRRTARTYRITDSGRARFHDLMLDITSSIGDYQRLFQLKVPHLEFLEPSERIQLIEHYRDYCRTAIRHREKNQRDMQGWLAELIAAGDTYTGIVTQSGLENALETITHMNEYWQTELAWADHLLKREIERR